MNEDNLIFPFILILLFAGWFFIFKISPSNQISSASPTPIETVEVASTETPPATLVPTQPPVFATPTPFATKPSINIPGGLDGGGFDD